MTGPIAKREVPGRALAGVLFACASLYLFNAYGRAHWLPSRFTDDGQEVFRRVLSQVGPIRDQLDIAYRVLAVLSLVWAIWSWRTERRVPAIIAIVFSGLAMFCAVFIVM